MTPITIEGRLTQLLTTLQSSINVIIFATVLTQAQNREENLAYKGVLHHLAAYRFSPGPTVRGRPGNRTIHLNWKVNAALPPTGPWRLRYEGPPDDRRRPSPASSAPPAPTP